ncbi:hypothetical protein FB451DRAFT_1413689 [Mycena latifolia]|nr:hypothetical protein FB451DRAFT_1413689 [Mycena latifolia]
MLATVLDSDFQKGEIGFESYRGERYPIIIPTFHFFYPPPLISAWAVLPAHALHSLPLELFTWKMKMMTMNPPPRVHSPRWDAYARLLLPPLHHLLPSFAARQALNSRSPPQATFTFAP